MAAAVTLFVYLLSRNVLYALATAVIFGTLAWMFRARDQHAEPIMLAIAAVTLSTMHQSSLGSLYLLMPNMLAPQWWSPVMPVSFFLSSIAAGTALVILDRHVDREGVAPPARDDAARLGRTDHVLGAARLPRVPPRRHGDPQPARRSVRRTRSAWPSRPRSSSAASLPLLLLARKSLRQRADVLFVASLLAVLGVAYNRMNVVIFAMNFRGRMPWGAPESYVPSIVEWGVSIGLIAATIFLFGLAARLMPVLSRAEPSEGH